MSYMNLDKSLYVDYINRIKWTRRLTNMLSKLNISTADDVNSLFEAKNYIDRVSPLPGSN